MTRPVVVLVLASASAIPALAQRPADRRTAADPAAIIGRAVAAMGGDTALRAVRGVALDFYGVQYALGQEETPLSPARATAVAGRSVNDYAGGRRMTSVELRLVTGAVNRPRRVAAGGIGMLETANGQQPDNPANVAAEETNLRRAPERLLLAALERPTALTALRPRQWRGEVMDGVRHAAGPDTLDLWFDRRTGLLTVMVTRDDHPVLGDREAVAWYTRWHPTDGVQFSRQYDLMINGRLQVHSITTGVTVNPPTPDSLFAIPDSIAARAQRAGAPPAPLTVLLRELAPGIWRAEGGSHHSLVVEQPGGLVVVEAPQHAERMRAVLDTLRARFPAVAIAVAVNTHHHWDHAGGVRAALAAGLPVITHARNAEFVRGIGTARKTIAADALSRTPRPPVVRQVTDSLVVGSGERRIVLYAFPTVHSEGMLVAYVPAAQLLFTSDVLSPGATLAPVGSREVVAFARGRGLAVAHVAGGHGGVAAWADLERAAGN